MKVGILGVDKSNHNYKKIYGWINAFSKISEVIHIPELDNHDTINQKIYEYDIDIIFGETYTSVFEKIDLDKIKCFVFWGDVNIDLLLEYSDKFKSTRFIMAHKSIMTEESLSHYSKISNFYMDVDTFKMINLLKTSEFIISENAYRVKENLYYTYLPCCLSEEGNLNPIEYDICYFGTTYNRPRVNKILEVLRNNGFRVKSTLFDGHIDPEDCIDYYSKTICTISEMVGPVYLEYPVRLGECSANGCKLMMIDDIGINNYTNSKLVPDYQNISDIKQITNYIESVKADDNIRYKFQKEFNSTYDNALDILMKVINL
jgi:hypothetical protein